MRRRGLIQDASQIKGTTVEIGGNTSGLEKSLAAAGSNSSILTLHVNLAKTVDKFTWIIYADNDKKTWQ